MYNVKSSKKMNESDREKNVIAIVGDTQVGLWVVRNLAENGINVHAVVKSELGQAAWSRYCDTAWILESDIKSPFFAEELKELVIKTGSGSIMPVSEGYHKALISNRNLFEPEIHIFSPESGSFDKATDKDFMHSKCLELDVPVAKGKRFDLLMKSESFDLNFPVVLRTRNQNSIDKIAPWKAEYAHNRKDLENFWEEVKDYAHNIIVQEYCPGAEDHVQVLMHEGEPFMIGEYIGEHHMPLAGGVTVQRISCLHEKLCNDAVKLLKAIDYEGIAGVQFHYDPKTDKYIFLEINPRFIGGTPTLIMSGFDTSFLLWQSRFEPEKMEKKEYKTGVRTRILGGDINWMLAMIRKDRLPPGQKRLSFLKAAAVFIRNSGFGTKDDSFLWRDPLPFCADFYQMMKKLGSQAYDILGNPDTAAGKQ